MAEISDAEHVMILVDVIATSSSQGAPQATPAFWELSSSAGSLVVGVAAERVIRDLDDDDARHVWLGLRIGTDLEQRHHQVNRPIHEVRRDLYRHLVFRACEILRATAVGADEAEQLGSGPS